METATTIQETYNIWSWLLPLVSGAIGALIGTYGGSNFLHWKQEKKIKNVRAMAVKALNVFRAYAKKSGGKAEAVACTHIHPSSAAYLQYYLVVAYGKVCHRDRLHEPLGLKVNIARQLRRHFFRQGVCESRLMSFQH